MNAAVAGGLLIVATAASLLSGPFLAPVVVGGSVAVAAIAPVTWITLIIGGLLLFRWFGRTAPPPKTAFTARQETQLLPR